MKKLKIAYLWLGIVDWSNGHGSRASRGSLRPSPVFLSLTKGSYDRQKERKSWSPYSNSRSQLGKAAWLPHLAQGLFFHYTGQDRRRQRKVKLPPRRRPRSAHPPSPLTPTAEHQEADECEKATRRRQRRPLDTRRRTSAKRPSALPFPYRDCFIRCGLWFHPILNDRLLLLQLSLLNEWFDVNRISTRNTTIRWSLHIWDHANFV